MMPRFSPPTAMALPRNRGSAACSTDAKKASASRWTMALCMGICLQSAPFVVPVIRMLWAG